MKFKILETLKSTTIRTAMATSAILVSTIPSVQAANMGDLADNVYDNFNSVGKLVVGGFMLGGVSLAGLGLLKMKQASDTGGQQVKYSEGMWRVGVGSALAGVPMLTSVGQETVFGTGANMAPEVGTIDFN